jgi:hypothetical protein
MYLDGRIQICRFLIILKVLYIEAQKISSEVRIILYNLGNLFNPKYVDGTSCYSGSNLAVKMSVKVLEKKDSLSFPSTLTYRDLRRGRDQGCQIFLGATNQNGKNET